MYLDVNLIIFPMRIFIHVNKAYFKVVEKLFFKKNGPKFV